MDSVGQILRYATRPLIPAIDLSYERQDPASFILDSLNAPWQPFHLCIPNKYHHSAPGLREPSYSNTLGPPPFWSPMPPPSYSSPPRFAREMEYIFDTPDIFHARYVPPPIPYPTYSPALPREVGWIFDTLDIPHSRYVLLPIPYPPVLRHAPVGEWIFHVPHILEPHHTSPCSSMLDRTYLPVPYPQYAPEVVWLPEPEPEPEYTSPSSHRHEQNSHTPISHIFAYDSKAGTLVTSRMNIIAPKPIRPIQHVQMELEVTWLAPTSGNQ